MNQTSQSAAAELCLVRYGELALKKGNRETFERALEHNIKAALEPLASVRLERSRGRILVFPASRPASCARRLQDVFGIASVSPAWKAKNDFEAIVEVARGVLERALLDLGAGDSHGVCVRAKRADKSFPLRSFEIERQLAERLLPTLERVHVDLTSPAVTLGIDVREHGTYVYATRLSGPGGLPVGTLGRGVCLISGGIDSPVAAYMAMKRGLELTFVTFHSYPYVGEPAKKKVVDLVRVLARFQPSTQLRVVPFAHINEAFRDAAPEAYRTVLYRRAMQRIAGRIAQQQSAGAVVTGEALGQVASQTLENLRSIEAAAQQLVVRPLIGFDKEETVRLARKIGTFDLSSQQEPDCCSVFLPAHPVLRSDAQRCESYEARVDWPALEAQALSGVEIHELSWRG